MAEVVDVTVEVVDVTVMVMNLNKSIDLSLLLLQGEALATQR